MFFFYLIKKIILLLNLKLSEHEHLLPFQFCFIIGLCIAYQKLCAGEKLNMPLSFMDELIEVET